MTQINPSANVKNLQNLLRPLYEKNVFKSVKILGYEDIHENIGLFLQPNCTNEQFHQLAVQIFRVFPLLFENVSTLNTESTQQLVELSSSMAEIDLNKE